jgi:hypothetical protein
MMPTFGDFALRIGSYMGKRTAGVGYAIDNLQMRGGNACLKIDCALLMGDLQNTFMLGATMSF